VTLGTNLKFRSMQHSKIP